MALKWRDKKDVHILSMKHSDVNLINTGKRRKNEGGNSKNIIKLASMLEYNKGMGDVDKQDQLLTCFPFMRKCVKGYKKIIFFI